MKKLKTTNRTLDLYTLEETRRIKRKTGANPRTSIVAFIDEEQFGIHRYMSGIVFTKGDEEYEEGDYYCDDVKVIKQFYLYDILLHEDFDTIRDVVNEIKEDAADRLEDCETLEEAVEKFKEYLYEVIK